MRHAAFITGVLALWAAVGSPLAALDHHLLTFHMVQHLLLMTVAAPLILIGAPRVTSVHLPVQPVFCWLASSAVVIAWHVPALFELGMHSVGWHAIEQASFFAAGLLFWLPVIQPDPGVPGWRIPLYLFLATLPCDALSAFLTFCNRVIYPHYLSAHRHFGISPLADQECAGALMWVWVTFAYLVPAAAITIRMLSPQQAAPGPAIIFEPASTRR
ncbi:MAG: 4Fe-4S ferredoxin, iron-sulfur binding domain protein [Candidatus Solibacter sp.]|jgi:putative membrane protein|nr:4Fe-4S ferredoxin, iron-sulfur binding domain protein [Candidatus Solibacter sp.]